jgi:hypothetical protein
VLDASDNTNVKSGSGKPVLIAPAGSEALRVEANKIKSVGLLDLETNTSDGSDNASIGVSSGGNRSDTRGGYLVAYGNEHASRAAEVELVSGNITGKGISYKASNGTGQHDFSIGGVNYFSLVSSKLALKNGLATIENSSSSDLTIKSTVSTYGIYFATENTNRWLIGSGGNILPQGTTGTQNIGSDTNYINNLYFDGELKFKGTAKNFNWNAFSSTTRTSINPAAATASDCAECINTFAKYLVEFGLLTDA